MENKEELISILNDLIRINNDRIEGYEKAIDELESPKDAVTTSVFAEHIQESEVFRNELSTSIFRLGGTPSDDTTASGKLYRAWMDVKTTFTQGSERSVFELCEFGEDAALKAYDSALQERDAWPEDMFVMLVRHRYTLKVAHDNIRNYRDELKHQHT